MATAKDDNRMHDDHQKYIPGVQEKASLGGDFNSGVTSHDPDEKREIEKKASLANVNQKPADERKED